MNDLNTAPPPPPTEPDPARPGNAWERRRELGFLDGLVGATRAFVTAPGEAFAQTRRSGDLGSPLLFAILVAVVTTIIGQVWTLLLGTSLLTMLPPDVREGLGMVFLSSSAGVAFSLVVMPVVTVIWVFLWGAIVHVLLILLGGLDSSEAGFEGSLRVVAYSSVGNLAKLVPVIGDLASIVWMIVLMVIGLNRIHGTTEGKAVAAVLLPLVLCCVCVAGVLAVGFGAIMSQLGN